MSDVALLVEGDLDARVGTRLLVHERLTAGVVYGRKGWTYIRAKVAGFNSASDSRPMLAIVDLMDTGETCAGELTATWLPDRRPNMLLRVAKPEIESWVLADRDGVAEFLGIRRQFVPADPDLLADAKQELMRLASRSKRRKIRQALVPPDGFSAAEGPLYNTEVGSFVADRWNVDAASARSPSLRAALLRIGEMRDRLRHGF